MGGATKFKFDVEFHADGDVYSGPARERQKISLTQEEIDLLCAEARADGLQAGEVRALEQVAAGAREATQVIVDALRQTTLAFESIRAEAAQVALATACKMARAALAHAPQTEVEAALREAMHQAIGEPRILLRVSPAVADAISSRLAEIAHEEGYDGRVQIAPETAIEGADCRIEWRGGGAERSEAAIEQVIAKLIARRFARTEQTKGHVDDVE
jgi:flagellar assembly protein FliH